MRAVATRSGAVGRVDHLVGGGRWHGGVHLAEDLRLNNRKCSSGPVLESACAGDQDAAREQPLAGRSDEIVRVRGIGSLGQQRGRQGGFVIGLQFAQTEVSLGPELALGKCLPALVNRPQAGDGWRRHGQDLGGVSQEVSGQHVETVERSTGNAHEHEHQHGGQAVVAAELLPDGRHVRRREREELLPIELTQPRRQGLLANEAQGEGGHGVGRRQVGGQCTAMAAVNPDWRSSCGVATVGKPH